jgi:hypothetical protein
VPEVYTKPIEKERRTPKANQLYRSEFLLAKDRIVPSDSHGRKKAKHHKKKQHSSAASYNAHHLFAGRSTDYLYTEFTMVNINLEKNGEYGARESIRERQ